MSRQKFFLSVQQKSQLEGDAVLPRRGLQGPQQEGGAAEVEGPAVIGLVLSVKFSDSSSSNNKHAFLGFKMFRK